MKLIYYLVFALFWLRIFIIPTIVFAVIGLWLYRVNPHYLPLSIVVGCIGMTLGALWAENVRKKHGLDHFWGRLYATPDIPDYSGDRKGETEKESGQ